MLRNFFRFCFLIIYNKGVFSIDESLKVKWWHILNLQRFALSNSGNPPLRHLEIFPGVLQIPPYQRNPADSGVGEICTLMWWTCLDIFSGKYTFTVVMSVALYWVSLWDTCKILKSFLCFPLSSCWKHVVTHSLI